MLRTMIWFLYFWIYIFCTIPKLIWVKVLEKQGDIKRRDEIVTSMAQNWARALVKLSGSNVEVIGEELIPTDQPVLFVCNHQSAFDIPILLGYINKPKAFVSKKEVKRLPIVGSWMSLMQCVFMNRKDVRQSLQAINHGAENLKKGYSLVIFPEGTRSPDGQMLEFKPGSLKLAIKSGVAIVPVTIDGSYRIMQKKSWIIRPADVKVIVSEPVDVASYSKDGKVLTEYVYTKIKEQLSDHVYEHRAPVLTVEDKIEIGEN